MSCLPSWNSCSAAVHALFKSCERVQHISSQSLPSITRTWIPSAVLLFSCKHAYMNYFKEHEPVEIFLIPRTKTLTHTHTKRRHRSASQPIAPHSHIFFLPAQLPKITSLQQIDKYQLTNLQVTNLKWKRWFCWSVSPKMTTRRRKTHTTQCQKNCRQR